MKSYIAFLTLSSLLLLTTKTNARTDPADYWNKFVNNEPLPELLKGLLDVNSKERTVPGKENIPFYPTSENDPMQYWNRVMKGEPIPDSIKDLLDANSKERRVPQMDKSYVYQTHVPDEKEATQSSKPTQYWNSLMKGEPIPDSIKDLLDANSKERRVPQTDKSYVYQVSPNEKEATQSSKPTQYWNSVMKGEPIPDSIKDLLDANSKERRVPQTDKSYVYQVSPNEKEATQSSKPTQYWNSVMKGEPIPDSIRDLLDANSKERRVPQMDKSYVYQVAGKESSNPTQYWDRVMKGEAIPEFIKDLLDASSKERRVPQMDKSYVYAVVGAHK